MECVDHHHELNANPYFVDNEHELVSFYQLSTTLYIFRQVKMDAQYPRCESNRDQSQYGKHYGNMIAKMMDETEWQSGHRCGATIDT